MTYLSDDEILALAKTHEDAKHIAEEAEQITAWDLAEKAWRLAASMVEEGRARDWYLNAARQCRQAAVEEQNDS